MVRNATSATNLTSKHRVVTKKHRTQYEMNPNVDSKPSNVVLMQERDAFDFESMQNVLTMTFQDVYARGPVVSEDNVKNSKKKRSSDDVAQESCRFCNKKGKMGFMNYEIDEFIKKEYPFAQRQDLKGDFFYIDRDMQTSFDRVKAFCSDMYGTVTVDNSLLGKLECRFKFELIQFAQCLEVHFCVFLHPSNERVMCVPAFVSGNFLQYKMLIDDLKRFFIVTQDWVEL